MDPVLSTAVKDEFVRCRLAAGCGPGGDDRPKTGRRSFLGRGAAAVAAAMAAFSGREARAGATRTICPACIPTRMSMEFKAIQTHENAHVSFPGRRPLGDARSVPSLASST